MPSAKKREPIVPHKVRDGIRMLFEQMTYDLQAAAKAAGLSTARFREELAKPHVRRWAWHAKRELIESICAGNPVALAKIRETSGNDMARVGSIKTLEAMRAEIDEVSRTTGPIRQTPGVTIIFESPGQPDRVLGPPPMRLIDSRPLPQFEPDRDAG
jgi:hypothetical protein